MLLIYIYIIISSILQPLANLYLRLRVKNNKEDPIRYQEKLCKTNTKRPHGTLIWFHAASVGESNMVINLIREIHTTEPDINFLVTTVTVNSANLIQKSKLPNTTHQYAPLDMPAIAKKFIAHWQPNLAIFVESEIWPNLLLKTKEQCKIIFINGRLSDNSFARWKKAKSAMTSLLKLFDSVQPGTHIDLERFKFFYAENINFIGNLKHAAPPMEYNIKLLENLQHSIGSRKVFIAASTHRGEEEIIINTHDVLSRHYPDLLTIIAPRHKERTAEIEDLIGKHHIKYTTHTRTNGIIKNDISIYLVDTIGDLGSFYRAVRIAFVGGSLVNTGGHNILEPAKLGLALITGQYTFNFTEIMDNFIEKNAVLIINGKQDLVKQIDKLLKDQEYLHMMQKKALEVAVEDTISMHKTVKFITQFFQ